MAGDHCCSMLSSLGQKRLEGLDLLEVGDVSTPRRFHFSNKFDLTKLRRLDGWRACFRLQT